MDNMAMYQLKLCDGLAVNVEQLKKMIEGNINSEHVQALIEHLNRDIQILRLTNEIHIICKNEKKQDL